MKAWIVVASLLVALAVLAFVGMSWWLPAAEQRGPSEALAPAQLAPEAEPSPPTASAPAGLPAPAALEPAAASTELSSQTEAPPAVVDRTAPKPRSAGAIRGRIRHPAPVPDALLHNLPPAYFERCPGPKDVPDPALRIGADRGLANVFVRVGIDDPGAFGAGRERRLSIDACAMEPRVLLLPAGATLEIANSGDEECLVQSKEAGIESLLHKGDTTRRLLDKVGRVRIGDARHPWTGASVQVVASRFVALTDGEGRFEIPDVPPGDYFLELWHEKLGSMAWGEVSVDGPGTRAVEIEFKANRR